MAEGVEGLTRDKTRTPGKRPLSTDTVQRVVDLALGPPPGEENPLLLDPPIATGLVESYVVDPASIATSRRRRRAKTDKIDGEALVRALLAYKRGEPRVYAMVRAPTPYEEDRRGICRERKTLTAERVEHVNRIKGPLFAQGISDYEPLLAQKTRAA